MPGFGSWFSIIHESILNPWSYRTVFGFSKSKKKKSHSTILARTEASYVSLIVFIVRSSVFFWKHIGMEIKRVKAKQLNSIRSADPTPVTRHGFVTWHREWYKSRAVPSGAVKLKKSGSWGLNERDKAIHTVFLLSACVWACACVCVWHCRDLHWFTSAHAHTLVFCYMASGPRMGGQTHRDTHTHMHCTAIWSSGSD